MANINLLIRAAQGFIDQAKKELHPGMNVQEIKHMNENLDTAKKKLEEARKALG